MASAFRPPRYLPGWLAVLALLGPGCRMAPQQDLEECHRLSQTLRSENAGLKDQMLALRSQNQDLSERAVDDARRLALLEASNQRLETSVQAYQDERSRLEDAYKQLRASLPGSLPPLGALLPSREQSPHTGKVETLKAAHRRASPRDLDGQIQQADLSLEDTKASDGVRKSPRGQTTRRRPSWTASRPEHPSTDPASPAAAAGAHSTRTDP